MDKITHYKYEAIEIRQGVRNLISVLERSTEMNSEYRESMLKQLRDHDNKLSNDISEISRLAEEMINTRRQTCTHKTVTQYISDTNTYYECTHCGTIVGLTDDMIILHKIEK